jgi:hypothetical protein
MTIDSELNSLLTQLTISPTGLLKPRIGEPVAVRVVPDPGQLSVRDMALPAAAGTLPDPWGPFANLEIPLEVPVRTTITWSIVDSDGGVLTENRDYVAPVGMAGPLLELLLLPKFRELRRPLVTRRNEPAEPLPTTEKRTLHVRFVLAARGVTKPDELNTDHPTLDLLAPIVRIPTILACFVHPNFRGEVLLLVPDESPLADASQVVAVINRLQRDLWPLRSVVWIASFLTGIGLLASALANEPRMAFTRADDVPNTNEIDLVTKRPWQNDIEAENNVSSIILIGPNDRKVLISNDREHRPNQGQFTLTVGDTLFTAVRDLRSVQPGSEPDGNELEVKAIPPRGWTFNDQISSINLDPEET